jgi:FRG domain.
MKTTVINSFSEYVTYTENYKNKFYFRGQANIEWDIIPSLFRKNDYISLEVETIKREMKLSQLDVISSIFKLQHYGSPTRICDLSISSLSALFFSIEDESQINADGVVYVVDKTDAVPFHSKEINLFSKVLTDNYPKIEVLDSETSLGEEIKEILSQNYIIQYDYRFSYTNQRAILQGGTGILFGFDCSNGIIGPVGKRSVDIFINERIIIPQKIKNEISAKLKELGFIHDILYQVFENTNTSSKFVLKQTKFDLHDRFEFKKILANYQIDNICFDRDELVKQIDDIYNKLFLCYGTNARIWLHIYLDENDLAEGNFICRTEWNKNYPYTIKWTKDYYLRRFSYINEQVSEQEVIEKFSDLIQAVTPAFDEISRCVLNRQYQLEYLLDRIQLYRDQVKLASYKADDIPKGNYEIEKFSNAAYAYIKDVERLIDEMVLYSSRGEKEQFLKYWVEVLLKDCKKTKEKLENWVKS